MAGIQMLLPVLIVALVAAEDGVTPKPKKVLDTIMKPTYVPPEEKHSSFWRKSAATTLKSKLQEKLNTNKAKNGILFIGDGMSLATVMAARTFGGQLEGALGEENVLEFERFPVTGLARTYCIDAQVPDSACTATSYLTGVKTKYGVIGLDGNVTRGSCYPQLYKGNWASSIGQWALDHGLDVGLVTTTRVTHASPAGMYAHTSERNWESDADVPDECLGLGCQDIAHQLIMNDPGKKFKVILGGGRREFTVNHSNPLVNSTGRRMAGLDLTDTWHIEKVNKNLTHEYVTDRNELMKIPSGQVNYRPVVNESHRQWLDKKSRRPRVMAVLGRGLYPAVGSHRLIVVVFKSDNIPEFLLGLFHDDHMDYHLKSQNQPTLEEMVEVAIKMLSRSPNGYFLFVEGGRIDHAHHENLAHLALDETIEYSKAIKKARSLTNEEETLLVVSSDHAHTMTVAGYPSRGNDILSIVDTTNSSDGKPYTTISYANGKGASIGADGKRIDVTKNQQFLDRDLAYAYPGLAPLDSETHGGEDVAVFALGPWQHLFTASYEQNLVPHLMAYAMCIGEEQHANCKPRRRFGGFWTSSSVNNRPIVVLYILSICAVIISCFRC